MVVRRTVIQERAVSQDIENAVHSYRLVDEAIQSLEWTLAHKPEIGVHRRGRFWVYMQDGFKIHKIPEIVVLYSFSDDAVILHAIVFRPPS